MEKKTHTKKKKIEIQETFNYDWRGRLSESRYIFKILTEAIILYLLHPYHDANAQDPKLAGRLLLLLWFQLLALYIDLVFHAYFISYLTSYFSFITDLLTPNNIAIISTH